MLSVAGTFDGHELGDRISGPSRVIDREHSEKTVSWAGYVHPLFTDPQFPAKAGFHGQPVPGELVLLLLGGLAEQTGMFDETTIALVELANVRFKTPASAGDTIRLDMEVTGKQRSESGRRGFLTFLWTCRNQRDEVVLEADAKFAFRTA
jgi:acyl dehydratase